MSSTRKLTDDLLDILIQKMGETNKTTLKTVVSCPQTDDELKFVIDELNKIEKPTHNDVVAILQKLPDDEEDSSSESDVMTREEGKAMLEEMYRRVEKARETYYQKHPEQLKRIVPKKKQT